MQVCMRACARECKPQFFCVFYLRANMSVSECMRVHVHFHMCMRACVCVVVVVVMDKRDFWLLSRDPSFRGIPVGISAIASSSRPLV